MSRKCRGITKDNLSCSNPANDYYCHLHEPGSRYISESLREEVFTMCGGKCFYCKKQIVEKNRSDGRGVWEVDYIRPHSQGGATTIDNLVAACKDCNRQKSDTPVREFREGKRRCEAVKKTDGLRCNFEVADGKYKYCLHHNDG